MFIVLLSFAMQLVPSPVAAAPQACTETKTQGCCAGTAYNKLKLGCCDAATYNLETEGCCNGTIYNALSRVCSNGKIVKPTPIPRPVRATPAPLATPVCTPPRCRPGEGFYCAGVCPGGCGTICATPTPVPTRPTRKPRVIPTPTATPTATPTPAPARAMRGVGGCCQFPGFCENLPHILCPGEFEYGVSCDHATGICGGAPKPPPSPVCTTVHAQGGATTQPCYYRRDLKCDGVDSGTYQFEAKCRLPFRVQQCLNWQWGTNGDGDWARWKRDNVGAGGCICQGYHAEKGGLFHWGAGHWSWCKIDALCCHP